MNDFTQPNRYIVAKIELQDDSKTGSTTFTDYSVYNCIVKNVQKFYGDLGVAAVRSGLKCKYCNDQTRIAIIRVKHKAHRFVTCTLALSTVVSFSVSFNWFQHIMGFTISMVKTFYTARLETIWPNFEYSMLDQQ